MFCSHTFPKNFLTNANVSMASLKTKCSIKKDLHSGGKWASTKQSAELIVNH